MIESIDPQSILRVICGIWFLPHCLGKIQNVVPASKTFENAGFKPGVPFVYLTIALELIAGAGLVLNILPYVAAGLAIVVLAGASYAVVKINGFNWRWQKQGPEYMVFWGLACILSVA